MKTRTLVTAVFALLPLTWSCGSDRSDPVDTSTGSGEAGSGDSREPGESAEGDWGKEDEDETGKDDPGKDRACVECWYVEGVQACGALLESCEADLACSLLMNCPYDCEATSDCVAECNEIVPTGVEPLTELVQCMACGGAPCATACAESHFVEYCG